MNYKHVKEKINLYNVLYFGNFDDLTRNQPKKVTNRGQASADIIKR